jgi:glutamine synthetase
LSCSFSLPISPNSEFFLLHPKKHKLADEMDTKAKPCYDSGALMRKYAVIKEISDSMLTLGWKPYQSDHEDGNGQFEMNWTYGGL